jgi:hypothetical protein
VEDEDPILRQRARALRLADLGQRTGYLLLGVAMIAFFVGLATGFGGISTTIVVVAMALAAVILAPAIILGYAAKAAERFEQTGRTGH